MRAWWVTDPGPIDTTPLAFGRRAVPEPAAHEVLVSVRTCGVCRTDLHLCEGDLRPHRRHTVPGHEIVGTVTALGPDTSRFAVGERVGLAWLRWTCGVCRFCVRGDENLCVKPRFTGWDDDGGYADFAVVHEDYAYRLPAAFSDEQAAPLLCAGIIGYRALRRANVAAGGSLGIYGFGGSAHLAAQVAIAEGTRVHVFTRGAEAQALARSLGVASAGSIDAAPPEPLDGAINFTPSGDVVPKALQALDRGGTLALAGIYMSDVPPLQYERDLFEERQVRSVTANTRRDGEEFLAIAAAIPIRVTTARYPLADAATALVDLAHGRVTGAACSRSPRPGWSGPGGNRSAGRPGAAPRPASAAWRTAAGGRSGRGSRAGCWRWRPDR
jgi:propanol-preferring alcohol dehydrogenase